MDELDADDMMKDPSDPGAKDIEDDIAMFEQRAKKKSNPAAKPIVAKSEPKKSEENKHEQKKSEENKHEQKKHEQKKPEENKHEVNKKLEIHEPSAKKVIEQPEDQDDFDAFNDRRVDFDEGDNSDKPEPESVQAKSRVVEEEDDESEEAAARAELKNQMLCDQLYKKTEELKRARQMMAAIETGKDPETKEKKLIELAKNNRSLKLKLETAKSQAAKVLEEISALKAEIEKDKVSDMKTEAKVENDEEAEKKLVAELQKRAAKTEAELSELRNKEESQKADLDKALLAIRREVGEYASIDLLLKEEPKAKFLDEKIKGLKMKISKMKGGGTKLPTPGLKASEKVFGKTDRKAKEIERLSAEIKHVDDESKVLKQKYAAATSRLAYLDKELKEVRMGETQRLKLLLEKSENSDKLISALKQERARLKKAKPEETTSASPSPSQEEIYGKERDKMDEEVDRLRAEIADLKRDKETLLENLQDKEERISELAASQQTAGDVGLPPKYKPPKAKY